MSAMSCNHPGSAILRKKWLHFASVLDYDKNGFVSEKDHLGFAERAISVGGIDPNSKQARQIRAKMIQTHADLYGCIKNGEPVTYEEVVKSYFERIDEMKRVVNQNIHLFFDMIDSSGDGLIQLEELRQYYYIFGLKVEEADQVFKMMDTDKDGVVNRNEYVDFVYNFFFSTDESHPSKHYFGILPSA